VAFGLGLGGCGGSSSSPSVVTTTATPTGTATASAAATATATVTATATATVTATATATGGATATASATNTATATATPTPTVTPTMTPTADVINFSPPFSTIASGASSTVTIGLSALDAKGNPLNPTASNPVEVMVYGAAAGVISPAATAVSTPSVTFTYTGTAVHNNIMVDAWINDGTGGFALGQTLIMPPSSDCEAGTQNYTVPLTSTVPNQLQVNAAVGYSTASSAVGNLRTYTIDTGSLGTVVTATDLPTGSGSLAIGPGGPGVKCYDSSNIAYAGNYYLAPVDVQVDTVGGTSAVVTDPIIVLAATQICRPTSCANPMVNCSSPSGSIHYMGVGFNRNSTGPDDFFSGPTENAFLHVDDANNGTDINPGYVLSSGGITLGINSTSGYKTINLTPNTVVAGDWNAQPACYSFPNSPPPNQFCGNGLLDVGISEMFIDLPFSQRPTGTFDLNDEVPSELTMNVLMGNTSSPAASYSYTTVQTPTAPTGPAPTFSQWIDTTSTGEVFVNTGRNPLNCYNYLFAGQCGQVGFQTVTPQPSGCSGAE
jgi:hypothetical protein